MNDTEDEADKVEGDEKENRQMEEDEEAEAHRSINEADIVTNLGVERRKVWGVEDLTQYGGDGDDQWEAPSKSWVEEELPWCVWLERGHLHHPEGPHHVEAGDGHPAEHGDVAEQTKESKDSAAKVTWRLVGFIVVNN